MAQEGLDFSRLSEKGLSLYCRPNFYLGWSGHGTLPTTVAHGLLRVNRERPARVSGFDSAVDNPQIKTPLTLQTISLEEKQGVIQESRNVDLTLILFV